MKNSELLFYVLIPFTALGTEATRQEKSIEHERNQLIAGAQIATLNHKFSKYLVSINDRRAEYFPQHYCGGSIYSPRTIITTAHCVYDDRNMRLRKKSHIYVIAGTTSFDKRPFSMRTRSIKRILVHPEFNYASSEVSPNDVALLYLRDEIDLDGETRSAVPLIGTEMHFETECTILGWGSTIWGNKFLTSTDLLYFNVMAEICQRDEQLKNTICVYPSDEDKGPFTGDSGAPLFCDEKQVGIASVVSYGSVHKIYYCSIWHHKRWILLNQSAKFRSEYIILSILLSFEILFMSSLL